MLNNRIAVFDTLWVIGSASQDGSSTLDGKASNSDAYIIEESVAARFNQGSLGQFLLFKKKGDIRLMLCGNREGRLVIRCNVRMLRRKEDPRIVMGFEPFVSYAGEKRIAQDKDALLLGGQPCMKAAGDWEVGAGGRRVG